MRDSGIIAVQSEPEPILPEANPGLQRRLQRRLNVQAHRFAPPF